MERRYKWLLLLGATAACVMLAIQVSGAPGAAADAPAQAGGPQANAPAPAQKAGPARSAGTDRMAERLRKLAQDADPDLDIFVNSTRLARLVATEPPADLRARLQFDTYLAVELLRAGRTADAVKALEDLLGRLHAIPQYRGSRAVHEVHSMLAMAHLRLGEKENCILHHGTESCLLPIRGDGVHSEQRGSRAGIRELTAILAEHPEDLRTRWLLNVAYMTVGEHPDKVPERWLIPASAFESDHDIGRFRDVAGAVGLDVRGLAGAAIMEDFDGDDYLDVFVTSWGLADPMRLLRNQRDGTFLDRTVEAGLTGIVSGLNAVHADYDNDGDMDVVVLRGAWRGEGGVHPPSLLRNRGNGTFDDVTEEAGLLDFHPSQVGAWGDYDNDGWVDLFIGVEANNASPRASKLYRNDGDGTFTEVAAAVGVVVVGFVKGASWGDYDNDGRLDLYVSRMEAAPNNLLFRNDGGDGLGGFRFTEVGNAAGVRGPPLSFANWFFDYDNDGWQDIFVAGYAGTVDDVAADYLGQEVVTDGAKPRLYRNQGNGTFRDVTREARADSVTMTMGCNFGDLDNDGWLDFYLGTGNPDFRSLVPNRMFRNAQGKLFQDVTTSGGFGHLQKGHGVAFGDLDNDGDQDVFLKVGGAFEDDSFQSALFENPGHGNHWITLKLVGGKSNRAAIGARIKLTVEEPRGPQTIHVTVTSGSSFGGSSLQQEIGLGQAERVRSIEITWPATGLQVLEGVEMDQALVIREGAPRPEPLARNRLDFAPSVAKAP